MLSYEGGMMRHQVSMVLLCGLLIMGGGCVTIELGRGSGAGVGVFSYLNGQLKAVYAVPIETIWPRAVTTFEFLQLHIETRSMDGLGATLTAQRADGTPIRLWLKPVDNTNTLVTVSVGPLGKRAHAERVHQVIYRQLGQ